MKLRKWVFLPLLLAAMLIFVFSCKKKTDSDSGRFTFRWHLNYDWASKVWGTDKISQYLTEKFNVSANMTNPDSLADEVLNLMIVANELPDVIWMERQDMFREMAAMGLFYSIDELKAMVNNNWYDENVPKATQNHYAAATGGVNYVIPNWVRMGTFGQWGGATGGNEAWMYTTNVWKALGSPKFVTLEDLFDYAVKVRDARLTNRNGQPIIPVIFNENSNGGNEIVEVIFLAYGGMNNGWAGWYSIRPDGTYGSSWTNPVWRDAVLEANRWFRERLFPATMVSQTRAQFEELLLNGRGGLIYYDHSQEDNINFRRILGEQDPGNSVEVIFYDTGSRKTLLLPGRGLNHLNINHQAHGTLGWNTNVITKTAKNPGRIFELLTYLLTPQGSIDWILGPKGILWNQLDSNGYPIITRPASSLSAEEYQEIGLWKWDLLGHANNVDNAKFAANSGLPEDQRSWVETMQQTLFSPNLRLTDEFTNIPEQIIPNSDLGISRKLIEDYFLEMLPQIITASSAAQAAALFDQVVAFANANRIRDIEAIYDAHWKHNCSLQNGSIYKW